MAGDRQGARKARVQVMSRKHSQPEPLIEAWGLLCRHRRRFVLSAFIVATCVLAVSLLLPRKYGANAIFERRTDMVMTEIINRGASQSFNDPRQSLFKEVAGPTSQDQLITELQSSPQLRATLGLDAVDMRHLRHELERKLTLRYEIASNELDQVKVSFVTDEPRFAQWAVNALIINYMDRTRSEIEQRLRESATFFRNEVAHSRETIEQLENTRLTFEIEHAELLPDNPNSIQTSLVETRTDLAELRYEQDAAALRIASLEKAIAQTPAIAPTMIKQRNPALAQLEKELQTAQSQVDLYVNTYRMTQRHPDVAALKQQIAAIQQEIARTEVEVVTQRELANNPKRNELELMLTRAQAEYSSLSQRHDALEVRIAAMNGETGDIFPIRSEFLKLERNIDQARRQLAFWEDNLRRVEMVRAAESGDRGIRLAFISPCGELTQPISPQLSQVLVAAIGLGLLAGAVSVFMASRTDEYYPRADQLAEALKLQLFGTVSEIITPQQRRARRLRKIVLYPLNTAAMAAVLTVMTGLLYINLERPELFKRIATAPVTLIHQLSAEPQPVAHAETETGQE